MQQSCLPLRKTAKRQASSRDPELVEPCGMQFRDTTDCKSALRLCSLCCLLLGKQEWQPSGANFELGTLNFELPARPAGCLPYLDASLNRNGGRLVMSPLVNVGHQNFSTCATTRSVPAK